VEDSLLGPVEGCLTDRFGTGRLALIGLLILGAASWFLLKPVIYGCSTWPS